MKGKRGQFTIFVVLGFVLMSVFAFMLFARSLLIQDKMQLEAERIVDAAIKTNNINAYVESCLDRITEEGVLLIAMQGGVIYESQGGTGMIADPIISGWDYLEFNFTDSYSNTSYGFIKVVYGIKPNLNLSCVVLAAPNYPLPNTSLAALQGKYFIESILVGGCDWFSGVIGSFSLKPLCEYGGENNISLQENICLGDIENKLGAYGPESLQEQLETYVNNKMLECTNFSIFQEIGQNITVQNEPITNLTFGQQGFTIETRYPFNIKIGRRAFSTIQEFQVQKKIKLKELYEYVYKILQQEYQDLNFELERGYQNTDLGWHSDIKLLKFANSNGTFDDIYQLTDLSSQIQGKPLIFNFAIKNRIPVLDYIDSGQIANIVVMQGQRLRIAPFGIDPDENTISYEYIGWKEDYTRTYIGTGCTDHFACLRNPIYYDEGPADPQNWSHSPEYISSGVNSSFNTTAEDIGLHYTVVKIIDEQGLIDFQNVSIMVFDRPEVKPSGYNQYDDISDYNASLEDLYFLNSESQSFFTNITGFEWTDSTEPFVISTVNPSIIIPEVFESYDIMNISNLIFLFSGTHTIGVKGQFEDPITLQNRWTTENLMTVEVHECLPHRSNTPSYPYGPPFSSNHTCCSNETGFWGNITEGNTCFTKTTYGANSSFVADEIYGTVATILGTKSYTEGSFDENDIVERIFQRLCDGSRGNICNGSITETRVIEDDCGGYTNPGSDDELCSGPLNDEVSESQISCVNYIVGETFNTTFGYGNGYCNENLRCATDFGSNSGVFLAGGKNYQCTGQCDGGGSCNYPVDCICGTTSCGADSACSEQEIGYTFGAGSKNERGCNNSCELNICTPYIFNNLNCKTSASSDTDCDDDYGYDSDKSSCVQCNISNIEDPSITNNIDADEKCEYNTGEGDCKAAPECDEQDPLKWKINDTHYCDSGCSDYDCVNYKVNVTKFVDEGIYGCYTNCASDDECSLGFSCSGSVCG